jgi:hypothetical protein
LRLSALEESVGCSDTVGNKEGVTRKGFAVANELNAGKSANQTHFPAATRKVTGSTSAA